MKKGEVAYKKKVEITLDTILKYVLWGFVIYMGIMLFILLFFVFLITPFGDYQSTSGFNVEACPKNMVTDKYYGAYFTSIYDYDYDDQNKYTAQYYIKAFEKEKNSSGYVSLIYDNHYIEKQGIDINIRYKCYVRTVEGANINYVYCGNRWDKDIKYTTPKTINEEGIIQPQQSYEIMWVIDIRTCVSGKAMIEGGEYGRGLYGIEFECDFLEIGCKHL